MDTLPSPFVLVYRQKKIDLSPMMMFRQCHPAMKPGYYETAVDLEFSTWTFNLTSLRTNA